MMDDIESLVRETLSVAESLTQQKQAEAERAELEDRPLQDSTTSENSFELDFPGPFSGLFYTIQRGASTFVIRALCSQNMAKDFAKIMSEPMDFPSLKLCEGTEPGAELQSLRYFECDGFEIAKTIKEQVANRRFSLHEEFLINVSDPGDSWWLRVDQSEITISFKMCDTTELEKLTKLGPLGDPDHVCQQLKKFESYFSFLMPVEAFSVAGSKFHLEVEDAKDPFFNSFKNMLITGEIDQDFMLKLADLESKFSKTPYYQSMKEANLWITKTQALRAFWLEISKQVI